MKLLDLLDQNETYSNVQLAEILGTTEEMVEAKLERYEQLGYIRKISQSLGCDDGCKGCHGCSGFKDKKNTLIYWERIK